MSSAHTYTTRLATALTCALALGSAADAAPLFGDRASEANARGAYCRPNGNADWLYGRDDPDYAAAEGTPITVFVEADYAAERHSCIASDSWGWQNRRDPSGLIFDEEMVRRQVSASAELWNLESNAVVLRWGGALPFDAVDTYDPGDPNDPNDDTWVNATSNGTSVALDDNACKWIRDQTGGGPAIVVTYTPGRVGSNGKLVATTLDGAGGNVTSFRTTDPANPVQQSYCPNTGLVVGFGPNVTSMAWADTHDFDTCSDIAELGNKNNGTLAEGFANFKQTSMFDRDSGVGFAHEIGHVLGFKHRTGNTSDLDGSESLLAGSGNGYGVPHLFPMDRDCVDDIDPARNSNFVGPRSVKNRYRAFHVDGSIAPVTTGDTTGYAQHGISWDGTATTGFGVGTVYLRLQGQTLQQSHHPRPGHDHTIDWSHGLPLPSVGDEASGMAYTDTAPRYSTGAIDPVLGAYDTVVSYTKRIGDGYGPSALDNRVDGVDTVAGVDDAYVLPPIQRWAGTQGVLGSPVFGTFQTAAGTPLYSFLPVVSTTEPETDDKIFAHVRTGHLDDGSTTDPNRRESEQGDIVLHHGATADVPGTPLSTLVLGPSYVLADLGLTFASNAHATPAGAWTAFAKTHKQPGMACFDPQYHTTDYNCIVAWTDILDSKILYTWFRRGATDLEFHGTVYSLGHRTGSNVSAGVIASEQGGRIALAWKTQDGDLAWRVHTDDAKLGSGGWDTATVLLAGDLVESPSIASNPSWGPISDFNAAMFWTAHD